MVWLRVLTRVWTNIFHLLWWQWQVISLFSILVFPVCGGSLTGPTGSFQSPAHPNYYPHGVNCTWFITVTPGFIIRLTFSAFALESNNVCAYDYVEVFNNITLSGSMGRYVRKLFSVILHLKFLYIFDYHHIETFPHHSMLIIAASWIRWTLHLRTSHASKFVRPFIWLVIWKSSIFPTSYVLEFQLSVVFDVKRLESQWSNRWN